MVGTDSNWLNAADDNEYYYPYAIGIKTGFFEPFRLLLCWRRPKRTVSS